MGSRRFQFVFFMLLALSISISFVADEGMWTFDNPPRELMEKTYGFAPDEAWLEHLRLSCIHVGASSAFISPEGLVLTNHHVAYRGISAISTAEKNYVEEGYYAPTQDLEIPFPNMSGWITLSIEDVTSRVEGAAQGTAGAAKAEKARQAEIARIEQEGNEPPDIQRSVVILYGGAVYHLYRYKAITDFRLVFAPERQIANYGGDSDNFTYPRHDLDMTILRAYENGKPYRPEHYLSWSPDGAKDGEAVFVPGFPYSTNRLDTMVQVEMDRDLTYPEKLADTRRKLEVLREYSKGSPEQARRAKGPIFGYENRLKALSGEYDGLTDERLMAERRSREEALHNAVMESPDGKARYGTAWDLADEAVAKARSNFMNTHYKTQIPGRRLPEYALDIVRIVTEKPKPNEERHPDYRGTELSYKVRKVSAPVPYYKDMEELLLALDLEVLVKKLGAEDPFVKTLLGGKTPQVRAAEIIGGTALDQAEVRRSLLKGGRKAVEASKDPLILLALAIEPTVLAAQEWEETEVDALLTQAATQINKARFAVYGWNAYPDATTSLRLSLGMITGYTFATRKVPPFTTLYGLYDRAASFGNREEFALPARYMEAKDRLNLATPWNFACTADIIGGNSGSPAVNAKGEVVGVVFDGNVPSLPNRFIYDEEQARCVAVDSRGMLEVLEKLYGAEALVQEIKGAMTTP